MADVRMFHFENHMVLPVISNQKMNDYLKELGELAEINEPVRETYYKGNERIDVYILYRNGFCLCCKFLFYCCLGGICASRIAAGWWLCLDCMTATGRFIANWPPSSMIQSPALAGAARHLSLIHI